MAKQTLTIGTKNNVQIELLLADTDLTFSKLNAKGQSVINGAGTELKILSMVNLI